MTDSPTGPVHQPGHPELEQHQTPTDPPNRSGPPHLLLRLQ